MPRGRKQSDRIDPRRGQVFLDRLNHILIQREAEGYKLPDGKELSREYLALFLGYESVVAFNEMVNGKVIIPLQDAYELADLLNIDINELVNYREPKVEDRIEFIREMEKKHYVKMQRRKWYAKFYQRGYTKEQMEEEYAKLGLSLPEED